MVQNRERQPHNQLRLFVPVPGTKGGLFCICVESRNLTWLDLVGRFLDQRQVSQRPEAAVDAATEGP